MVPLSHLWLPIIASAVAVFVVSALLHMLFTYHNSDYRKVPNEDEVRAAINKGGLTPGQYILPYAVGMGAKDPVAQQKMKEGPTGFLLLRKPSGPEMGPALGQWFVLTLVIALLVAYVAALTIAPGRGPHGRVPGGVGDRVPGVCRLAGAGGDLAGGAVVLGDQDHHRWSRLRAGDGGLVRPDVARSVSGGHSTPYISPVNPRAFACALAVPKTDGTKR